MHEHNEVLAALVGQPNSGKSTVFNYLTGLHQTIANYPGVTVTKKSGHYHDGDRRIEVVDLPGTYSLTSYSQEERVTRDFLLLERPEVVVAVVDASNLRRHLYFVFQLLELRIPLVVCLNMTDIAQRRGLVIDIPALEKLLGVPVVPTNGRNNEGMEDLRKKINEISALHDHEPEDWKLDYGPLEDMLGEFEQTFRQNEHLTKDYSPRWLAIKLLENDREARRIIQHHIHEKDWESFLGPCLEKAESYEKTDGESPRKTIASRRNEKAKEIEAAVINRAMTPKRNSDQFDRVLCHPLLGLVAIVLVMFLTFLLSFSVAQEWAWVPWAVVAEAAEEPQTGDVEEAGQVVEAEPVAEEESDKIVFGFVTPTDACGSIFEYWIPKALDNTLQLEDGDLKSLIYNGIVAGVGGVLGFVPVIFFIFLFVSALNQSGYMARVIVVMDRIMRVFGLHGQSVLPMILAGGISGGCAVPAVMATRTMREPKERLLTILVIPIMNCGAKLPVYGLIIAAFFARYQALLLTGVVVVSWTIALLAALVLSKTMVKGESTPLVIELPTYQVPSIFEIFATACRQSWMFIKKAGTIILAVNVLLWVLMNYPAPKDPAATKTERLNGSIAASIGRAFEPVSRFAGFDWRDNIALIGGFMAKEVIVSSLATIYEIEESDDEEKTSEALATRLQSERNWSPVKALALLIFVMVYAPCIATCAAIRQETGSWKFMFLTMAYTTILATILAVLVYQIGMLAT